MDLSTLTYATGDGVARIVHEPGLEARHQPARRSAARLARAPAVIGERHWFAEHTTRMRTISSPATVRCYRGRRSQ